MTTHKSKLDKAAEVVTGTSIDTLRDVVVYGRYMEFGFLLIL